VVRRNTRTVGLDAERLAFDTLRRQGLVPVSRNFRCRLGEIDLIMLDDACLVFVEVRYRASNRIASAKQTVDIHKQRKLIRSAALFVARRSRFANSTMRFDVVAIDDHEHDGQTLEWIKDAFRPGDSSL
jgi:putative endonuclease